MKVGTVVKLNKEGRSVHITLMWRWKGEVLGHDEFGRVLVAWFALSRCESCGQSGDTKIFAERPEWLTKWEPLEVAA